MFIKIISVIFIFIVAIVFFIVGILNMNGNIKMLHSYHRNNVKEEDKKIFGKLVGIGVIINSLAIIAIGILTILTDILEKEINTNLINIIILIGFIIGLGISLFAIKKYNKKIIG